MIYIIYDISLSASHGFDGRACLLKSFCTAVLDVDTTEQKSGMLFKLLKLIVR